MVLCQNGDVHMLLHANSTSMDDGEMMLYENKGKILISLHLPNLDN